MYERLSTVRMRQAKPTQEDITAAFNIQTILDLASGGELPSGQDDTEDFDADDPAHLAKFYNAIMTLYQGRPGGLARVVAGMETVLNNNVLDPDDKIMSLHPRLTRTNAPDQALLVSMAMRVDHAFGIRDSNQQQSLLDDMRHVWEEVEGKGFYKPGNRGMYLAQLKSDARSTPGSLKATKAVPTDQPERKYTYEQIMVTYHRLLLNNAGKALVLSGGMHALRHPANGWLVCGYLNDQGEMTLDTLTDFPSFSFAQGCWAGSTPEAMSREITNPTFVDLPEALVFRLSGKFG